MSNFNERLYFSSKISVKERACFETGIKLGALYHILCGIPISSNIEVINSIEKGIEAAISCQPYVKYVKIDIDQKKVIGDKTSEFAYDEITGKIIRAKLIVEYETIQVSAKIDWIEELKYPLMFIEKITEID